MELKTSNHPETPITYLPAGSGNDFARAAHLSKKPEELVNRLLQNLDYHPVGCGKFISSLKNNRPYYFVNNLLIYNYDLTRTILDVVVVAAEPSVLAYANIPCSAP